MPKQMPEKRQLPAGPRSRAADASREVRQAPFERGAGDRRGRAGDGNFVPIPSVGEGKNGAANIQPQAPATEAYSRNVSNPSSRVGPSSNPRWLRQHGKG